MISSSNFFKKTFFNPIDETLDVNKKLGPWLEVKSQTIDLNNGNKKQDLILDRSRYKSLRSKRLSPSLKLPIITSKKI